jgi:hypothetical protein
MLRGEGESERGGSGTDGGNCIEEKKWKGRAFDLDVGKALVYCHGQPPHLPRPDVGLTSYSISVKLLFQERLGGWMIVTALLDRSSNLTKSIQPHPQFAKTQN